MSSWASRDVGSGGQGRVASWLGKVPGYSGYKNKETRRDEDKRVREELAREYGQYAQRLTDLQGELVRSHRLTDIGTTERLERSLRLFADRVRVATYGYGGLFSDRSIDERALDQLQAFDRALGDGLDEVRSGVEALESAGRDGGDLAGPARQLQATIDGRRTPRPFDSDTSAHQLVRAWNRPGFRAGRAVARPASGARSPSRRRRGARRRRRRSAGIAPTDRSSSPPRRRPPRWPRRWRRG